MDKFAIKCIILSTFNSYFVKDYMHRLFVVIWVFSWMDFLQL